MMKIKLTMTSLGKERSFQEGRKMIAKEEGPNPFSLAKFSREVQHKPKLIPFSLPIYFVI